MIIKGRSPTKRHVSRTHRVALDWLFDRVNLDAKIQMKFVESKNQLADILTRGNFTRDKWHNLLHLFYIMNDTTFSCSHFSKSYPFLSAGKQSEMSKRSQESSSPGSPMVKAKACCLVSRQGVSVGEKIIRVTLKAWGVQEILKCGPGKKKVQTLEVVLFSMPRETESMTQKILEVSQKRKPRETESTCEKSFKI